MTRGWDLSYPSVQWGVGSTLIWSLLSNVLTFVVVKIKSKWYQASFTFIQTALIFIFFSFILEFDNELKGNPSFYCFLPPFNTNRYIFIYSNYVLLLNEILYFIIIWHKMLSNSPKKKQEIFVFNLMRQVDGKWFPTPHS